MRLKLALAFLVVSAVLVAVAFAQPSQSDRYRYNTLVATARLWNMIRYLHPRVTGESTDWDRALLAAIPKVEDSHSDEELGVALDGMLKTLHDPCTRIAMGLPGKSISVDTDEAATLVIHAGNGSLSGTMGAGLMLSMGIPQASNIVWDLRGTGMPYSLARSRADVRQLDVGGIGYAYREHSGYSQPGDAGSPYYSSLKIVEPRFGKPAASVAKFKQIFLIDKTSAVPVQAIVEQSIGKTAIISEDPPGLSQAGYTEMVPLLGSVVAEVRVADLRYPDGTTEFAPTRVVLNRGQAAVKAATNAISGEWGMPGERPKFQPGRAGFHDMEYAVEPYPNREMRILAAIRIWGVLHYFHPYVSLMGSKWDDTLIEFLPRFIAAKDTNEYNRAVAAMVARTNDVTCTLRSSHMGAMFSAPGQALEVRFLDDQAVVTRAYSGILKRGDVIVGVDGKPVAERIEELSNYLPSPTREALMSLTARHLVPDAEQNPVKLTVRGSGDSNSRDVSVYPFYEKLVPASRTGDAIRMLNESVGYADLEQVQANDVDGLFDKLAKATGIIFDLRGYPRDTALAVAARLGQGDQPVAAALFRNVVGIGANNNHISFLQANLNVPGTAKARYKGKTVALIDDVVGRFTGEDAMYFKAANQTTLIGTAAYPMFAAYRSTFDVPGGIKVSFSGQIPRWPGGKLLYPEGVRPDVEVRPTLAGIRAGRDEVLDAAVAYLAKQ